MADPLLQVRALDAHYGDFQALFGVSMRVTEGEVVAVIGANGAGKSTLLKCIAGAMPVRHNAIQYHGVSIGGDPAHEVVSRGIALAPDSDGAGWWRCCSSIGNNPYTRLRFHGPL